MNFHFEIVCFQLDLRSERNVKMMKENYKIAIVGSTGVVGRTVLKVLEEKRFPHCTYTLFSSHKSAGQPVTFLDDTYVVRELQDSSFDSGFDFAIFCAGGEVSKKFAPIAASKGCIVIDNSSVFRMDDSVPLVVPEVNPEKISENHGIIANPNCSTIQAVVPLKPLDDTYGIKRVVYSTYQAVSGAGRQGILDLEAGMHGEPPKKFPYPIFNNCLPQIDVFLEDGYTKEEHKLIDETRKILNKPNLAVTATAVRVPVRNCHSESICVSFEKDFDIFEVKELLKKAPGVLVVDEPSELYYPLCTKADGYDDVLVGRIRRDMSAEHSLHLWVVADNLRKGAASNAVQILGLLLSSHENC